MVEEPILMNAEATASMKLIDFPPVQTRLNVEEEQVLLRILREAHTLSVGPEAEAFEKEWTKYLGCGDAVAGEGIDGPSGTIDR